MKILRLACGLLIACRAAPPAVQAPVPVPAVVAVTPAPISEWPVTLTNAAKAAESGDYERADRILITHGLEHAGTPDAIEAALWRAIFAADPLNPRFQFSERLGLLDAALAAGNRGPRAVQATVLRRLMEATDSMSAVLGTVRTNSEQRVRGREEEIRKLTDELDRTTAELERIKKRLTPRPPGGQR
jgi:hypothetical protein